MRRRMIVVVAVALGSCVCASLVMGQQACIWDPDGTMQSLGGVPGNSFAWTAAVQISHDATVVFGNGYDTSDYQGGHEAFRWTAAAGMEKLTRTVSGTVSGTLGTKDYSMVAAQDISGDASVVVGYAADDITYGVATIWDSVHGWRNLRGVLVEDYHLDTALDGWTLANATGVSTDGKTVVGYGVHGGHTGAFVAVLSAGDASFQGLDVDADYTHSAAYGVAGEGTAATGCWWPNSSAQYGAYRWTKSDGQCHALEIPSSSGKDSGWGGRLSDNGSTVVGDLFAAPWEVGKKTVAFRWTDTGGMESLPIPNGYDTTWSGNVSGDGSVVVGTARKASGEYHAFRWTLTDEATGTGTIVLLEDSPGALSYATGVTMTGDGPVVVGCYTVPEPATAILLGMGSLVVLLRRASRSRSS